MGPGFSGITLSGISRRSGMPLSRIASACAVVGILCLFLWPWCAAAQDGDAPLGDVARNLRKGKAQPRDTQPLSPTQSPSQTASSRSATARPIIDNDNLADALDDLKRVKSADKLVFSVDPGGKNFSVSAPDVTCSMSFNARAASLLIKPIIVEDLPPGELAKLDGPASIQDDNLQLEVFNGTEWELREITVGITLERKAGESAELAARARIVPAADSLASPVVERHSDVTVLYHLKATARPFSTTVFREAIGTALGADQEWHWSIVEAKGIRPEASQPSPDAAPVLPALPLPTLTERGNAGLPGLSANAQTTAATASAQQLDAAKMADKMNADRTTHDQSTHGQSTQEESVSAKSAQEKPTRDPSDPGKR
jgi:hypothetical protein